MFNRRYGGARCLSAIGIGTLIAFYCPARVLIILLAITIILLGLSLPRY